MLSIPHQEIAKTITAEIQQQMQDNIHWDKVINDGFGMVLDGNKEDFKCIQSMLFWDVNNEISKRNWTRNEGAIIPVKRVIKNITFA